MSDEQHEEYREEVDLLQRWKAASEAAPHLDEVYRLRDEANQAEHHAASKRDEFQRAAVQRASVAGFVETAEVLNVSPKALRMWSRRYPDIEDLAAVPVKAMRETERAIAAEQKKVEQREAAERALAEHIERKNYIEGVLS